MEKAKLCSRVRAEIDLDAVEYNLEQLKRLLLPGTKMIGVVKTDGYGHGALPIARLTAAHDYVWGLGVATLEEAMELRQGGIEKPILILGYTFPEDYEAIVKYDLRPAVFQLETARLLSEEAQKQGKPVRVHIKVDTGMSRIGFADCEESAAMVGEIAKLPNVEMEGIFTHFTKADEVNYEAINSQIRRFENFTMACREQGVMFQMRHCANSAGIMEAPLAHMDAVRAGITIYGLYPSKDVHQERVELKPAMSLKSHIVYLKEVEAGTSISYGGTYTTEKKQRIATIPVGYGDGYPRLCSNKGFVLVDGKRAPIRGRICMDQMMVDVTDIPNAREGMEVTLVGEEKGERITVEEIGEQSGRFNYEFVCCLNNRVPRVYYRNGQVQEIRHG